MDHQKWKTKQKIRRAFRIRRRVKASRNELFRMSVSRSLRQISVQIIDDVNSKTIVSASSLEKELLQSFDKGTDDKPKAGNRKAAVKVGELIAKRAKEAGVTQVRFDRGSYRFHGRVAALADAARKAGLKL